MEPPLLGDLCFDLINNCGNSDLAKLSNMIRCIKTNLLSRDTTIQAACLQYMIKSVVFCKNEKTKNKLIHFLIVEDVVHLIHEVIATTNAGLLRLAFSFLLILVENEEFYDCNINVSIYVSRVVVRSLNILVKQETPICLIKLALSVLSTIIKRIADDPLFVLEIEPLVILVKRILSNNAAVNNFISVVIPLISYILQYDKSHELLNPVSILLQTLHSVFTSNEVLADNKEKIASFLSDICSAIIRCGSKFNLEESEEFKFSLKIGTSSLIPYITENYKLINSSVANQIYACILSMYDISPGLKLNLTKSLVLNNFLNILIQMGLYFEKNLIVRKMIASIVAEIILVLSVSELKIEEKWVKQKILDELLSMSKWNIWFPNELEFRSIDHWKIIPITTLILTYIQFLINRSFSDIYMQKILILIRDFITDASFVQLPEFMIRCVWLIFAISYLSVGKQFSTKKDFVYDAQIILVNRLSKYDENLSQIYTHHPAILLWLFASPASNNKLKFNVLILWLTNCHDEISKAQIIQLCLLSNDIIYRMSDVMCGLNEDKHDLLNVCYEIMCDVAKNLDQELGTLPFIMWSSLLNLLDLFLTKFENFRGNNLTCILKICLQITPIDYPGFGPLLSEISIKLMRAIPFVIIKENVLEEREYILVLHLFRAAIFVIRYFTQVTFCLKVLENLFSCERFFSSITKILEFSMQKKNFQLYSVTLYLCCMLLNCQTTYNINYDSVITIKWDNVIFCISQCSKQSICHMIRLLQAVFSKSSQPGVHPVISFESTPSISTIRILYSRLLANVMKGESEVVTHSYYGLCFILIKCELLLDSEYNDQVLNHFLSEPWTCYMIKITLDVLQYDQLEVQPSISFIYFLNVWISKQLEGGEIHNSKSTSCKIDTIRYAANKILEFCEEIRLRNKNQTLKNLFISLISGILRTDCITEDIRKRLQALELF